MFIAPLFTIAPKWKRHKCPPTDEWLPAVCYLSMLTHAMEYYLAIKRNKVLVTCYDWTEPQKRHANKEANQSQESKYYVILFI